MRTSENVFRCDICGQEVRGHENWSPIGWAWVEVGLWAGGPNVTSTQGADVCDECLATKPMTWVNTGVRGEE